VPSPKITTFNDHLLFELPPQALAPAEFHEWIARINQLCRDQDLERVLIWRKHPVRLRVSTEDILRTIHLLTCLQEKRIRIALAFPAAIYNEMLDQFTLLARRNGLVAELFFDLEMARAWLLER